MKIFKIATIFVGLLTFTPVKANDFSEIIGNVQVTIKEVCINNFSYLVTTSKSGMGSNQMVTNYSNI